MKSQSWKAYKEEGLQYLNTAVKGFQKRKIFTPVILYNLFCMAIEKLIMALLTYRGTLPDNHTLNELASSADRIVKLDLSLIHALNKMDQYQRICDLSAYKPRELSEQELGESMETALRVKDLVQSEIQE